MPGVYRGTGFVDAVDHEPDVLRRPLLNLLNEMVECDGGRKVQEGCDGFQEVECGRLPGQEHEAASSRTLGLQGDTAKDG
jgi:hypothetical protein